MIYVGYIAVVSLVAAQQEQLAFDRKLASLPEDARQRAIDRHERERQEAVAERRHRELCDAIRSTSFWRFGS